MYLSLNLLKIAQTLIKRFSSIEILREIIRIAEVHGLIVEKRFDESSGYPYGRLSFKPKEKNNPYLKSEVILLISTLKTKQPKETVLNVVQGDKKDVNKLFELLKKGLKSQISYTEEPHSPGFQIQETDKGLVIKNPSLEEATE